MFSPLFFVLMSGVQQKSSVPCPISQAKGTKLLILSSAVPPGFHPCTDAGRLSERRNGAQPFCASELPPFAQTAQERTSASPHTEALSAGEASLFAVRRKPTLSVAAFGSIQVHNQMYTTTFRESLQGVCSHFPQKSRPMEVFAQNRSHYKSFISSIMS